MKKVKEIKRYANRRLYDSDTSKTITLEEVAGLIQEGFDIRVTDNRSGEDITARILGQTFNRIFIENENPDFSVFLLTAMIRELSGNLSRFFARLIRGGIGVSLLTPERINRIVRKMVEQGEIHVTAEEEYLQKLLNPLKEQGVSLGNQVEQGLGMLRHELTVENRDKFDELSTRLDEMVRLLRDIKGED